MDAGIVSKIQMGCRNPQLPVFFQRSPVNGKDKIGFYPPDQRSGKLPVVPGVFRRPINKRNSGLSDSLGNPQLLFCRIIGRRPPHHYNKMGAKTGDCPFRVRVREIGFDLMTKLPEPVRQSVNPHRMIFQKQNPQTMTPFKKRTVSYLCYVAQIPGSWADALYRKKNATQFEPCKNAGLLLE
ncbi:hypothetical protein Q3C12_13110 [Paenibacillus ehimensis]|uniref:Uncharacterized protein n=1 Tax=Paenibacillus ehimensis TaxID=79264 RepID=A0ABT8VAD5_9BACL|nr:hypothetical protein [Paenibacillus ehimensis]MDO3677945.1 hypothetical protein [Paenibacillus ehimensis]MEC0210872.1 hypothetical protein [Paenibacillus ehimensis]